MKICLAIITKLIYLVKDYYRSRSTCQVKDNCKYLPQIIDQELKGAGCGRGGYGEAAPRAA
jgi:hypothetical protein